MESLCPENAIVFGKNRKRANRSTCEQHIFTSRSYRKWHMMLFVCLIVHSPYAFAVGNCTFEESMCEWRNDAADDLDWRLIEGETFSMETGPSAGYGGQGRYTKMNTLIVIVFIRISLK